MPSLGRAARRTLVEYFKKTSLNGFGLLYFIRKRRFQRFFWFLFIATGILFASYVVLYTLLEFLTHPTVTELSAQELTIGEVAFPTLSICSASQLSRRAVRLFAGQLAELHVNSSLDYWLQQLPLLAGYFAPALISAEAAETLQTALGGLWAAADSPALLLRLAPSCESQLLSCRLAGVSRNCSQIFKLKHTDNGCCCVFNPEQLYKHNVSGVQMGLSLLLNASQSDAFRMPRTQRSAGHTLHISAGSSLRIAPSQSFNVELRAVAQVAEPSLRKYAVPRRGCQMPDEGLDQQQCLAECKVQRIVSKCSCLPYPYAGEQPSGGISYCTLAHIGCLQLEETAWSPGLPDCQHCLPLCSNIRYEFRQSRQPRLGASASNYSALNVYYRETHMPLYLQNELYNWYQILSNIGGVIGICIGCSVISGIEIIYFLVFRLLENFRGH